MKTVAVIFGGRSAEHDVSIVTALANVIKPLELTKKYQVEAIYIAKNGAWYWDNKLKDIKTFSQDKIKDLIHRSQPAALQFDGGFTLTKPSGLAGRRRSQKIDIVFPSMHGTYGEDGALMGLLDMSGVAYVGCGLNAATIAMDKVTTKVVAEASGIPVPKFTYFSKLDLKDNLPEAVKQIKAKLNYPLFVKPAHMGSSIAISRAANDTELSNGLELAIHYDDKVLIEEGVANLIEVTLPIIGNDTLKPALLEQPLTQSEDFFDFDTKYMHGGKKGKGSKSAGAQGYSHLPAELPADLYKQAEQTGLDTYKALGCTGIARVDLLINEKTKTVYLNEVNPMPGSLYAHNWAKAGLNNVALVEKLIDLAEQRHAERTALTTTFTTNYLKQFS